MSLYLNELNSRCLKVDTLTKDKEILKIRLNLVSERIQELRVASRIAGNAKWLYRVSRVIRTGYIFKTI